MLSGNSKFVATAIERHNEMDGMTIGVVGPDGSPVFNTSIQVPSGIFSSRKDRYVESGDQLIFYKALANDKACHQCHAPEDKIRGMIVINSSLAQAQKDIAETAGRLIIFAVFLGLASEAFLIIALRKKILDPLGVLHRGALRLKSGRLDHRIQMKHDDEIGALASCFNEMAESIERSHADLENAVQERTNELRVAAELSSEVFRGNLALNDIIERFLIAITDELGYRYASLCFVDRETGLLSHEFTRGAGEGFCAMKILLSDDHPLAKTIQEAVPSVKRAEDLGASSSGATVAVVPILSRQRRRCRDINLCRYETCPAFSSEDDRCWLMDCTLCRSPQSVAGKDKICGCLHCPAFPVLGVLIAGREEEIGATSLHSFEVLASELASAIENQDFIEAKKADIAKLVQLHSTTVGSLQSLGGGLERAIVTSAPAFSNADAAVLWVLRKDGMLHPVDSAGIDRGLIPCPLHPDDTFVGRSLKEGEAVETVEMKEAAELANLIGACGFLYAASIPLTFKDAALGCLTLFRKSDFPMSDSERAITLLFASQAAAAINTMQIYNELKAEKEFTDAIFSCASSGIMVLDGDGRVLKMNAVGAEILRLDAGGTVGQKIAGIYPEMQDMLVFGEGIGREITITLPSGEALPIGFANSRLFASGDDEKGIVVLFRNLTEIKRLQAEVRKKEHFSTMAKVISGVAHEIRNPLFGISSIGQILERELDSPQHKALAQAMLRESDRMKRLIEELLLYTKPSRLVIKEVDLAVLFEELGHYLKAKKESLALSVAVPPLTTIRADHDKITQVFLNLLNNAVDAARKELLISASTSGSVTEVRITDDGLGIREADLARVFDPFFTTKKGGTGLGLPICKKIVEDHGATIELFSEEDRGTTVTLVFRS